MSFLCRFARAPYSSKNQKVSNIYTLVSENTLHICQGVGHLYGLVDMTVLKKMSFSAMPKRLGCFSDKKSLGRRQKIAVGPRLHDCLMDGSRAALSRFGINLGVRSGRL